MTTEAERVAWGVQRQHVERLSDARLLSAMEDLAAGVGKLKPGQVSYAKAVLAELEKRGILPGRERP